jgi:hypothetical protein
LHHCRKPAEFCGLFPLGYPKVFRQNVMQCRCSKSSAILSETRMRRTRVTPLRYLAATDASGGVTRQQRLTIHMKVPSTTMLSFPTLSPLLTAGKNIVVYFLDGWYTQFSLCLVVDQPPYQGELKFVCFSLWYLYYHPTSLPGTVKSLYVFLYGIYIITQ